MRLRLILFATWVFCVCGMTAAQDNVAAKPVVGLRDNRPTKFALSGARVVVQSGQTIENATVLVDHTSITSVGHDVIVPPGFMTIDCTGQTIYAGLIDAYSDVEVPRGDSQLAAHWNSNITPQRNAQVAASGGLSNDSADLEKLRSQGITVRLVAPRHGIIKGSSCAVLTSDEEAGRRVLKERVWQHLSLTVPTKKTSSSYPNSPMGATALLRQTLYDAQWYRDVWQAYRTNPTLPRPEINLALRELQESIADQMFVVDTANERMAIRADAIANEFSLSVILRGSGREYRDLDAIVATRRPILLPIALASKPHVDNAEDARNTTLQNLMHWDLAPENPARLWAAGATICLTSDGLKNVSDFLKQTRVAVSRGLPADAALAALTTTPAKLLGLDATIGKVKAGQLANLLITDGDLFDKKTKVLETWVAGKQFIVSPTKTASQDALVGRWSLKFTVDQKETQLELDIIAKEQKLIATLSLPNNDTPQPDQKHVKPTNLVRQKERLDAAVRLSDLDSGFSAGLSQLAIITVAEGNDQTTVLGTIRLPSGETAKLDLAYITPAEIENTGDERNKEEADESTKDDDNATEQTLQLTVATPMLYPLGAFGVEKPTSDRATVMFRGGMIWTCGEAGLIESGDVLVRDGKIVAVGEKLAVPEHCQIIDARGRHITPGLIDCHSHTATDGGVNESGQAVTAEVRIGDFINNSDINLYRQLAGGVTTANILHGSANPIGGQNQVIKLRWGHSMQQLRMVEAPPGIKFALGENVKRNRGRYPNTRMGVEQIIRDQLLAAREYDRALRDHRQGNRTGLPPRRDLQLDAMAEVQRGERWIHCHSYRQDEITATLDLLEEFGIRVGTLQHILEGYKVADRMAKHGAMASAFSDWWSYKVEMFDAIPHNGALMHEQRIVVSFNSDDPELARHLNTEAAKAIKYGGLSAEEALKFVTLNPAKQLRIDQFVGSIETGKHGDLVLWSGPPLSTTSRCVQTWIDGQRFFDLDSDRAMRQRDTKLHAALVQKVIDDKNDSSATKEKKTEEENRWARHDVYCTANGENGHRHSQGEQTR